VERQAYLPEDRLLRGQSGRKFQCKISWSGNHTCLSSNIYLIFYSRDQPPSVQISVIILYQLNTVRHVKSKCRNIYFLIRKSQLLINYLQLLQIQQLANLPCQLQHQNCRSLLQIYITDCQVSIASQTFCNFQQVSLAKL